PVGIAKTHPDAPRVLIANSLLVPAWARWDEFRRLEAKGLTMYGQMTAGSWIYIGTQGILQGTYETFAEAARQHFGGTLRGSWTATSPRDFRSPTPWSSGGRIPRSIRGARWNRWGLTSAPCSAFSPWARSRSTTETTSAARP